jgi:hypothetical protein
MLGVLLVAWCVMVAPPPSVDDALAGADVANPAKRAKAVGQLARYQDPRVTMALLVALKDDSPKVRVAALKALASAGDEATVAAVQSALADKDKKVAAQAKKTLARIKARTPKGTMRNLLGITLLEDQSPHSAQGKVVLDTMVNELHLLGYNVVPQLPPKGRAHLVQVHVQDVTTRATEEGFMVDVSASATVLTFPGRNLRFNSRTAASEGLAGGTPSDDDKKSLTTTAAQSAGRALAQDVAAFLKSN